MQPALTRQEFSQPGNQEPAHLRAALDTYPDCRLECGLLVSRSAAQDAVEFLAGDGGRTVYPIVRVAGALIYTIPSPITVAEGVHKSIGTGLIPLQGWESSLRETGHSEALIGTVRGALADQPFKFCYKNDEGTTTVAGVSQEKTIEILLSTTSEEVARNSETNALASILTRQDYEFVENLRGQLDAVVNKDRPWKTDLQVYPEQHEGTADFLRMVRSVANLANAVTIQPENPILQKALEALQSWPESSLVQQLQSSRTLRNGEVTSPKWYDVFIRPVVWCAGSKTLPIPTTPELVATVVVGAVTAVAQSYFPSLRPVINSVLEFAASYPDAMWLAYAAVCLAPIAELIRMSAAEFRLHESLIGETSLDPETSQPVAAYRLFADLQKAKNNNFSIG